MNLIFKMVENKLRLWFWIGENCFWSICYSKYIIYIDNLRLTFLFYFGISTSIIENAFENLSISFKIRLKLKPSDLLALNNFISINQILWDSNKKQSISELRMFIYQINYYAVPGAVSAFWSGGWQIASEASRKFLPPPCIILTMIYNYIQTFLVLTVPRYFRLKKYNVILNKLHI